MKWLLRIVIALVILLVIALIGAFLAINTIAKHGIEQAATYALGVDTTVDGVSVGVLSGEFGMAGLQVNNPQGFTDERFLTMTKADLAVGLGSLMEQEVHVPRFGLDGITLNLEKKDGKANYDIIMENLQKLSSGQETKPKEDSGPGKTFVIDQLDITNVTVNLKGMGVGGQSVKVPDIHMTGVGSDGKGVDAGQITGIVMSSIFQALAQNVANLPGELAKGLGEGLKKLGPLTEVGAKVIGDVAGKAGEIVGDVTKSAGKAVGDLGKGAGKTVGDVGKNLGKGAGETAKEVGQTVGDIGKGIGNILGGDKDKKKPKAEEEKPAQ
jgi:hypothetical protein